MFDLLFDVRKFSLDFGFLARTLLKSIVRCAGDFRCAVEERLLRFPRRRLEPTNLALAARFARNALEKLPEPTRPGQGRKRGEVQCPMEGLQGVSLVTRSANKVVRKG